MARTIAHRELRNNSSAVLDAVSKGETINVTNHGKVVAILRPADSGEPSLAVRPARVTGGFDSIERVRLPQGDSTAAIIDDLRGDR